MGVIIMNASRNEKLLAEPEAPSAEKFYRYVLRHRAVHTTIMGLRNLDLFERVAAALAESIALSDSEEAELEVYGTRMRAAGKLD